MSEDLSSCLVVLKPSVLLSLLTERGGCAIFPSDFLWSYWAVSTVLWLTFFLRLVSMSENVGCGQELLVWGLCPPPFRKDPRVLSLNLSIWDDSAAWTFWDLVWSRAVSMPQDIGFWEGFRVLSPETISETWNDSVVQCVFIFSYKKFYS